MDHNSHSKVAEEKERGRNGMIAALFAVFAGMVFIDVPRLVREKSWRELIVYSVFMSFAFFISVAEVYQIPLPNPVRDTQYFVKSLIPFGYD